MIHRIRGLRGLGVKRLGIKRMKRILKILLIKKIKVQKGVKNATF
jgi:hypothetical protein